MADSPPAPSEEPVSSQLREAAKWLIASFGAIAAVVAAGIQFGEVGKIDGGDLYIALAAAGAAFLGIGIAMVAVMRLLVPRARSMTELVSAPSDDPAVAYINANPETLQGYGSLTSLNQSRKADQQVYHAALQKWRADLSAESAKVVKNATAVQAPTDAIAEKVVFWANYQTLKHDFNRAMYQRVLPGVALAAIGLTLFAIKVSEEPASSASTRLKGAWLSKALLRGSDLHQADLSGANLTAADLADVDLSGANLKGAKLDEANLTGANLRGAQTDASTSFAKVTWRNSVCPDGANSDDVDASCAAHMHAESSEKDDEKES